MGKEEKFKAGHYEIQGETIAKFEFFDKGFNPYSRYLDVDKVDLILRKRQGDSIKYIEIQVKYGRLYPCIEKWSKRLFDFTSWKMFKLDAFSDHRPELFITLVLPYPDGYKGDIFVFPAKYFDYLIRSMGIPVNTKKGKASKIYLAHAIQNQKWYLWRKWNFDEISDETCIDVTPFRRNFEFNAAQDL